MNNGITIVKGYNRLTVFFGRFLLPAVAYNHSFITNTMVITMVSVANHV